MFCSCLYLSHNASKALLKSSGDIWWTMAKCVVMYSVLAVIFESYTNDGMCTPSSQTVYCVAIVSMNSSPRSFFVFRLHQPSYVLNTNWSGRLWQFYVTANKINYHDFCSVFTRKSVQDLSVKDNELMSLVVSKSPTDFDAVRTRV